MGNTVDEAYAKPGSKKAGLKVVRLEVVRVRQRETRVGDREGRMSLPFPVFDSGYQFVECFRH